MHPHLGTCCGPTPVTSGHLCATGLHRQTGMMAAGKDATEDFEEIGHSNSAREMLDKYEIGKFEVRCCTVALCA